MFLVPSLPASLQFPLLSKELVELSARRRTYVVRAVYALALYGVTLWTYARFLKQYDANSFEMLGQGRMLLDELLRWQFWGLYLFLPVVTSSAITSEKERETLPLLLMTKLGSWTILFEKLLSRLVAMGSFLLLGLPLAGVAYSLGGVDLDSILKAVYVLCVTALQVAAFALLCSTWFRTTSSAFVGTYLLGTVGVLFGSELLKLVLGIGIAFGVHKLPWPGLTDEGREWFVTSVSHNPTYRPLYGPWLLQTDPLGTEYLARMAGLKTDNYPDPFSGSDVVFSSSGTVITSSGLFQFQSGFLWANLAQRNFRPAIRWWCPSGSSGVTIDRTSLRECVICSLPLVGSAIVFLILARVFLWRRMQVPETSLLAHLFVVGDRCFQVINRNPITRGVVFGSAREDDLPAARPIAWRETRKRSLGTARHLVRLLLLLEVPLLAWIGWRLWRWDGVGSPVLASGAMMPLLILVVLIVTIQSTGLIAGEKVKQTLDVLLTTPLTSRDIALQKLAGLRRLMLILAVPLLTIVATDAAIRTMTSGSLPGFLVFDADKGFADSFVADTTESGVVEIRLQDMYGRSTTLSVSGMPHEANRSGRPFNWQRMAAMLSGQIVGVVLYLPLLGWIGFQFGMRLRTQTQAIWATLAVVLLVCVGPSLLVKGVAAVHDARFSERAADARRLNDATIDFSPSYQEEINNYVTKRSREAWLFGLGWLNPLVVLYPESHHHPFSQQTGDLWLFLLFHFGTWLGTLWLLRRNALTHFGRWVQRSEAATGRTRRGAENEAGDSSGIGTTNVT